eukprot:3788139-Alexandrium_andersonii.AAC.1
MANSTLEHEGRPTDTDIAFFALDIEWGHASTSTATMPKQTSLFEASQLCRSDTQLGCDMIRTSARGAWPFFNLPAFRISAASLPLRAVAARIGLGSV